MLEGLRAQFHDRLFRPRLDWVQVEVTTDCTARCGYCPTAQLGADWPRRHMPLATFERILPAIAPSLAPNPWGTPLLHLQGWGEPLLNPDFPAMVAAAKGAGLAVGTTTNAMRLDDAMARHLVHSGIDLVAVSVAGIDGTNDSARRGTRWDRVRDALEALARVKHDAGRETPAVHIAYMLLGSGLDAIERIPGAFTGRGVAEIVVGTLAVAVGESTAGEAVAPRTEAEYRALADRLDAVAARAAALGMALNWRLPHPGARAGLCADNVQAALVVTVDGWVTPCVVERFAADGSGLAPDPLVFGDLTRESLARIWWKGAYVAFRRSFWDDRPPARCRACPKLGLDRLVVPSPGFDPGVREKTPHEGVGW